MNRFKINLVCGGMQGIVWTEGTPPPNVGESIGAEFASPSITGVVTAKTWNHADEVTLTITPAASI
jgi:hypothetical protein